MQEMLRGIKTNTRIVVNCCLEEPAKNYERITWFTSKLFFEVNKIYHPDNVLTTYHVRISNLFRLDMNKTFLVELSSDKTVTDLYNEVKKWFIERR